MSETAISDFVTAYKICCDSYGVKPIDNLAEMLFGRISVEEEKREGKTETGNGKELVLQGNSLELFNTRLQSTDVIPLSTSLERCKVWLCKLDLSYNNLTDDSISAILDIIKVSRSTLETINLSHNDVTSVGSNRIVKAIEQNETVTSLNLHGNPIGLDGGLQVAKLIKENQHLKELDIGNTEQQMDSIIAIATEMRHNSSITMLNLDNPRLNSLGEETTIHLAQMLKKNSTLRTLSLEKHKIRCHGASTLAEYLQCNNCLRHLNLKSNMIGIEGAKSFSILFLNNDCLTEINLQGNRIHDEGACALGGVLQYNNSLESINLSFNGIKDSGLCSIARGISKNSSVSKLFLWGNEFGAISSQLFYNLSAGRFKLYDFTTDFRPYIAGPGEQVQVAQL